VTKLCTICAFVLNRLIRFFNWRVPKILDFNESNFFTFTRLQLRRSSIAFWTAVWYFTLVSEWLSPGMYDIQEVYYAPSHHPSTLQVRRRFPNVYKYKCSGQEKPDSWSRRSEVHIQLGCWEFGVGREWERVEMGEVSLQVTWDQDGRILSQQWGIPSK
jgi:hypothetical protein